MSHRSEEFMEVARQRLVDARKVLSVAHPPVVVSAAYYAKTHKGTWILFSERYVATDVFDRASSATRRGPRRRARKGTTRRHRFPWIWPKSF